MKRVLFSFLVLFCFCLTACETLPETIPVTSVTISQPTAEMIVGETVQLKATVLPDNAPDKTVQWASSKQSVATISDSGLVTAIAEGTSTITATAGGKTGSCQVTVSKKVIAVTSISLNKEELTLVECEDATLVATVMPENATDKTVVWTSSSPDIARVDGGRITAIKAGEATITAKAGELSASCKVVVSNRVIAVESIELNKTSVELIEGDSDILVATVLPGNATDKTVTWITSDESIVTVDNSGKIKAIKEGKATVAAKAGEETATCAVTVSKRVIPVESITLDKTTIVMTEDESTVITATVKPDNASDKTIIWSCSDIGVATINDGRLTAIKEGSAIITAKAGEKTATCEVTVNKRVIAVSSVTLNYSNLSLTKGDEMTLVATVKPDNATDKTVTWSTSNGQVAKVDFNGLVTALKSGTATITAKAGDKTATCVVTVTTPIESVSLDRTSMTLEEGQTTELVAIISPSDADDKNVIWSSSSSSVASVDQTGKLTAVKAGTTTITAQAGDKTATCTVTVQKNVVQVISVTLNKTNLSLSTNQTETLLATVKPDNATDKNVNWSSSDATIASVDANGMVTAHKGGQAIITAKAGEQLATCAVTVTVPVSSISLNQSSLDLTKGQSATLIASVQPYDASVNTVIWSSSNQNVATVDQNGNVIAKAGGTAKVTASCGGFSAECSVTVTVPVTSITLNNSSLSLTKGATVTLSATVNPSDATDKTVSWSSSDASVATVTAGTVTAKKSGSAIITASAGGKTTTCTVTVTTPVTSISLDKTSISLKEGQSTTLSTTVYPSDADDKSVTWSSSSTSVATVDDNGRVFAVKEGTATIIVITVDGGYTATCTITVTGGSQSGTGTDSGHEWVDLGLPSGLKWASCNVGANVPGEYGDYFAWGETVPYYYSQDPLTWKSGKTSGYNWKSYQWCNGSYDTQTKYCTRTNYGIVDNKTVLDPEDDAANVNWGGSWRMPTDEEWTELRTECTWTWTTQNGVNGMLVTGPNGNSIFLPAAGYRSDTKLYSAGSDGQYWSSSLYTDGPSFAHDVLFTVGRMLSLRYGGYSVRPVTGEGLTVAVTSVSLNKGSTTLKVGETETLTATVQPTNATDKTITWNSTNTSVATVTSGIVTAKKSGSAIITASAGGKTTTCTVTVTTPVTSISLDKTSLTVEEGQSTKLTATVNPSDADDKTVTWSSSNQNVATVDQNGKVVAKAGGTTKITASCGGFTAECTVTVAVPVTSITLNKTSLAIIKGATASLTATVNPSDATDKTVIWNSSDESVAAVSSGTVTAKKSGTATITAKAGDKTASCTVTVTTPVTSISLDKTSLALEEGTSANITATINPSDADDKTVTWSSSSPSIATVDNNGRVTAINAGSATISARAGDKTVSCNVTVQKNVVQVTSITLNKTSLSLTKGQTEVLIATVKPDNATNKTITWSSSDTSVASVDANGKVTAHKGGQAVITAKSGEKSANCAVTVTSNDIGPGGIEGTEEEDMN